MTARVALIDSGVNCAHPHIRKMGTFVSGPTIETDGSLVEIDRQQDTLGHGTAAAAAILDIAPGSCIYSIKVFHEGPDCPFGNVLIALDHAIERVPHLINLSLGTPQPEWRAALQERVQHCADAGVTLVSPATIGGLSSLPGSLVGVAGVIVDPNLPRERPEQRTVGDRRFWFASPYPRDLPGVPREANLSGASMAAANLTGFLARELATKA